ncbi:hypothetical protein KFL_012050030 [Klebsormidium nitens]|uniref:Retrovirus-related Pol polyprotein from transposon TNT 1-94-like beta-barrel domain-containing protein n=1 Tax=Klebsormidium nitens TaxID=105231 RepID=A0A1Y1IVM0_KLENI|nr:hypothetical protein KFL_012050030 [Klebsormidium nitens]|eukprot:GAQ92926.1 hypothetical protein KFL_012050030 [Klebsormidium nitens]
MEKGHIRAHCRNRNVETFNCGERGHINSVCRKLRGGATSGSEDRLQRKEFVGVAFTAWRKEARVPADVWLVDSRSTQHITPDKRHFACYERVARAHKIEGLGGEALMAVGIGKLSWSVRRQTERASQDGALVWEDGTETESESGAEVRPVKVIEVDLESDDESDDGVKETQRVDVSVRETESPPEKKTKKHGAMEAVGAAMETMGATAAEA